MTEPATILIIDDEPGIRFALKEALTRDGHHVVAVDSGEAALEQLTRHEFDLALIDLKLSGISGMELLSILRARWPDTVAIVLTAYASLETAVEALRQGAHDYLFKPCKTIEIRESVRSGLLKRQERKRQQQMAAYLERSLADLRDIVGSPTIEPSPPPLHTAAQQARFVQRGDLIVDLTRHVITLEGRLLELSPTEFNLLAYLASEAPRVLTPQELIREVQGYESEPWEASDTVRSHIYRIRRKIKEATGRTDIIRTVRGTGYTILS